MTKDELKKQILTYNFEQYLQGVIYEMIDKSPQVNHQLLLDIADLVDLEADYFEEAYKLLDQLEEIKKQLNTNDKKITELEFNNKLKSIEDLHNKLILNFEKKLEEILNRNKEEILRATLKN